jgi:enoyl-CoA hydratase/carnithine racemase
MSPFRASAPLTTQWQHFRFSVDDGVATVTLDRPDKLNALTFEAYADLRDLLAELPQRGDARVQLAGADAFADAVTGLARRLASGPAQAYAQTKALLTREQDMSLSAAVELEAMTQALLMKGQDYAEFHAAFTSGRAPRWQGK